MLGCQHGPAVAVLQPVFVFWRQEGGRFSGDPHGSLAEVGHSWEGEDIDDTVLVARPVGSPAVDSVTILALLAPTRPAEDSLPFDVPTDSGARWRDVPGDLWVSRPPQTVDAWEVLGAGPDTTPYTIVGAGGDTSHKGTNAHWLTVASLNVPRLIEWAGFSEPTSIAVKFWRGGSCVMDAFDVTIPV